MAKVRIEGDGTPIGNVTPPNTGVIYIELDALPKRKTYISYGLTNADWQEVGSGSGGGFGLNASDVVELDGGLGNDVYTWNCDVDGVLELRADDVSAITITIDASAVPDDQIISNKMILAIGQNGGGNMTVNINNQLGDMYYIDEHTSAANKIAQGANKVLTLQDQLLVFDVSGIKRELDNPITGNDSLIITKIGQGGFTINKPGL